MSVRMHGVPQLEPPMVSAPNVLRVTIAIFLLSITLGGVALAIEAPGLPADQQPAVEKKENVEEILKGLLPGDDKDGFVYRREGRMDPFLPFVSEEKIQAQIESEEKKLTGMQLFEPGQLTLVGIVTAGGEPMAMVQDSVGKGYVIRKGMKIGRMGMVAEIAPNTVLIKELISVSARTKKKSYKTTKMVLKKEGEN